MLADRIKMGSQNKPGKYVIPTDSDFEFVEYNSAPNTYEEVKGYYHYIGTDEYVLIPHTINGNELKDYYRMFYENSIVKGVASNNPNVTNMANMFRGCSGLTSIDLTPLDTTNVTNMANMFRGCSGLTSIDLTPLDTTNVTNMANMFYGCSGLTSIDLTPLDTSNVTTMASMFSGCSGLTSIDLTSLNTSSVTNMDYMFRDCSGLTSIDLTPLDTTNVTNMASMFYGCSGLTSIDLTPLDTTNVTNMANMFYGCSGLTSIDLTPLDTTNVTNMASMFYGCSGLTSIDLTPLDTTNVTNMASMFYGCSGLTSIDLTPLDTSNVTTMASMFSGCSGLTSIDLTSLNTSSVTNMDYMFRDCSGLTSIDLTPLDTTNVTNMASMFSGCSGLWYLYVSVTTDIDAFKTSTKLSEYVTVIIGNEEVKGIEGEPPFYLNFNWTETINDKSEVTNLKSSIETIPIDCTLRIVFYDKNSVNGLLSSICVNGTCSTSARAQGNLLELNANDTIAFEFSSDKYVSQEGHMSVHVYNYQDVPAYKRDIYIVSDAGCYLTTCMVDYYGKDDDGIELNSMRALREHYKEKHADTLKEYYIVSRYIIEGIEKLDNKDYWYNEIKKVVDKIVIWVANEEWDKAEIAYLDLYYKLKRIFYSEVKEK